MRQTAVVYNQIEMDSLEQKLIRIARSDLKAARALFNEENYPQAVFLLQQAIEKTCKVFAIQNDLFKESELRKMVRHDSNKVFSKLAANHDHDYHKLIYNFLTSDSESSIGNLLESKEVNQIMVSENFDEPTRELIDELIAVIENEDEVVDGVFPNLDKLDKEASRDLLTTLIKKENVEIEITDEILTRFQQVIEQIPKYSKSGSQIMFMSMLFSKHSTKSRYPTQNFDPIKFYNANNPLVNSMPFFFDRLEVCLNVVSHGAPAAL